MRILADVNIPKATVDAVRLLGHDVAWALELMATDADFAILATAQSELRIVLTNDKDFGDLAVRFGLPAECGVVLLRLGKMLPDDVVARTIEVIASRDDWAGHFTVVDRRKIRMRSLS